MSRGHKMSNDSEFSRSYLALVHKDVKRIPNGPKNVWSAAWTYKFGRDSYEFHGPDQFYCTVSATNGYEARAKGWASYIQQKHPTLHAQLEAEAEKEFETFT